MVAPVPATKFSASSISIMLAFAGLNLAYPLNAHTY
jgi:hypothetical protein